MDVEHVNDAGPNRVVLAQAYAMAAHQCDPSPVLVDPLALRIAGVRLAIPEERLPGGADFRRDLRLSLAMAHRYADDVLISSVAAGLSQLVVLGAGPATTCYRRRYPESLRMFEVDRSAIQRWKRQRLADAGIELHPALRFVPLDDQRLLAEAIGDAGFDQTKPTLLLWLDNAMFLSRTQTIEIFDWMSRHSGQMEVVYHYLQPPETLSARAHRELERVAEELATFGQPWLTYSLPKDAAADLSACGFTRLDDLGWSELTDRYAPARHHLPDPLGVHVVYGRRAM